MPDEARSRPRTPFRRKAAVALSGTGTIAVGIVLLPLPGPGMFIIFVGLTILSREFPSATRVLDRIRSAVRPTSSDHIETDEHDR